MRKRIAVLTMLAFFGCSGFTTCSKDVGPAGTAGGSAPTNIDQVLSKCAGGTITGLSWMDRAARVVMPILYWSGIVDQSVYDMYKMAAQKADRVLPEAKSAYDAYMADPNSANESALQVVYQAACDALDGYNQVNGRARFVDDSGNILLPGAASAVPAK